MVARERSAVVIEPGFIVTCSKHFIYRLRKICPFLALNLVDAMGAHSPSLVSVKEFIMSFKWDCVLTSNINDSMKYGWIYRGITCSRTSGVKPSKKKSDAYLICGLKGNREQLIYDTFRKMNDEGAKCRYEIWCHNKKQFKEVKFKNEIKYSLFFKKYKKVASLVLSTNCIVEIVQEGHNNGTLRWFEAITLNKKLLTNNRGIFNMPFYNPLYMKYFEKAEDIDVEWVKRVEKVEYGYNNDFSSINLLNRIKSEIKNRGLS